MDVPRMQAVPIHAGIQVCCGRSSTIWRGLARSPQYQPRGRRGICTELSEVLRGFRRRPIGEHSPTISERERCELRRILQTNFAFVAIEIRIEAAVSSVAEHPYLHQVGRLPGTREIVAHPNFIVVYQVTDRIEVISVVHSRQNYP